MNSCARCGTSRPTAARFCPTCGLDFLVPAEDRLDVHIGTADPVNGHTAGAHIDGGATRNIRLAITGAAALLALIIGWSVLAGGNTDEATTATDDPSEQAATNDTETGGTPATDETRFGTERSSATDRADDTGAASEAETGDSGTGAFTVGAGESLAPDSPTSSSPSAPESPSEPLGPGDALAALGLPGFLVQASSQDVQILDLSTGQLVDVFEQTLPNAEVTDDGILCCGTAGNAQLGSQGDWTLHPWDGSAPTPVVLENRQTVRAIVNDPDVGLLLIVGETNEAIFNAGLINGSAIRVDTGERKPVDLHESQPFAVPALWGTGPGDNMLANIGNTVYAWRWETGWTELSEGVMRSAANTHYVADLCINPSECVRTLHYPDGDAMGELPADLFMFGSNVSELSPDGRELVTESFSRTGPTLQILDIETGEVRPLRRVSPDSNQVFSTEITWVTSEYVALRNNRAEYDLVNVATNESLDIPGLRSNREVLRWMPDLELAAG